MAYGSGREQAISGGQPFAVADYLAIASPTHLPPPHRRDSPDPVALSDRSGPDGDPEWLGVQRSGRVAAPAGPGSPPAAAISIATTSRPDPALRLLLASIVYQSY